MSSPFNIVFTQTVHALADMEAAYSMPLMNVTRMTDLAPQYQAVSDDSSIPIVLIAGAVLILAAIAGGVFWYYRLSIYHRGLIDRLAAAAELSHTAEMFLSPSHFDAAIEEAKKAVRLRRHHHGWLGEIRRTLFDS